MEEMKKARDTHNQKKQENEHKRKELSDKILEAQKSGCDLVELKKTLKELEDEAEDLKKKEEELDKKEKLTPWNVDTISHSGFSKTVLNTKPMPKQEELTDEEKEARMEQFIKDYEKEIKEFGMLRRYDDSKRYLQEHPYLVCEETANYFVIWCIKLQMEGKSNLMDHVAHQCICMQFIFVLAKQFDIDPRACVSSFFSRIQVADLEYKQSFDDELIAFKDRIRRRAEEKLEIARKEQEELEKMRQERLGPGGLDPVEVFETLPDELKKCFETRDIPLLKETIAKMDKEEARYHMQRCVASGLWIPDGKKKENDGEGEGEGEEQEQEQDDAQEEVEATEEEQT
ncbi:UNVERIFIED_CONTAM: hypothetical protein PYX00_003241 [Menopon gallinae]